MVDIDITLDDPTSTNSSSDNSVFNQRVVEAKRNLKRQMKQVGNTFYEENGQELFRERVLEALDGPAYCKEIDACEYDEISDSFYEAFRFVDAETGKSSKYTWFAHPHTYSRISTLDGFFDDFVHDSDPLRDSMKLMGAEVNVARDVPEGWVLLALSHHLDLSNYLTIRPHPMALITDVLAGYPCRFAVSIGGEMEIRVING